MANFAELTVQLELQQAAFNKGMDAAAKQLAKVSNSAAKSQKSLASMESTMQAVATAATAMASAFGAIKTLEGIAKASQQLNDLKGSFTALLGSAGSASDMMARVFALVERTGVPLEAAGASMQRLTIAMGQLGASNRQIETVAETFIQLGKVGGSSAAETAAALQQLGQALASGKLGGDELRSISENAPLVSQAIAQAIGVTTGQLKQLGEDGKLTSDVVANALIKASAKASAAFAQLPQSLEQALNKMESQATQAAAAFDKASGTTQALVTTTQFVADMLARWTTELQATGKELNSVQLIAELIGDVVRLAAVGFVTVAFALEQIIKRMGFWGEQIKLMLDWDWSGVLESSERFRIQMEASAAAADATIRSLLKMPALVDPNAAAAGMQARGAAAPQPEPLKPPALSGGGGKGGGKSEAEREAEALKKRGEALAASVDAQEAYNQKLREYDELLAKNAITQQTFELAVAKAKEELTAAGDALTASVDPLFAYEQQVKKITEAYMQGQIEVETYIKLLEKLKEELDKGKQKSPIEQLTDDATKALAGGVGEFFSDIIKGSMTAQEAFNKMVKSIISDLAKLVAEFATKAILKMILGGGVGAGGLTANPDLGKSASLMLASAPPTFNAAASLSPTPFATPAGAATSGGVAGMGAGGPWNVTVNNNAPGVDVSTATRPDGGLEVTIERVRSMLAQDVMRGGNNFSRSLESAYSLGRGR